MTVSAISETERLRTQLKRLALPTIAQIFEEEATKAATRELSYTAFLARLIEDELAAKRDRSVSVRPHPSARHPRPPRGR